MGGLSKHMMHPQDNLSLTCYDLKKLIRDTFSGQYELVEKVDGFNIHILKHRGQLWMARNIKDLEVGPGFGREDIKNRFKNDYVRSVFEYGYDWFNARLDQLELPEWEESHQTLNCEIVRGQTNIMPYPGSKCFIHNVFTWTPEPVVSEYTGATFKAPVLTLRSNYVDVEKICSDLDNIFRRTMGTPDVDGCTIRDYYWRRFVSLVLWSVENGQYEADRMTPKQLHELFKRFFRDGKSMNLWDIRKMSPANLDKFLADSGRFVVKIREELEKWTIRVGNTLLDNVTGYINEDSKYEVMSKICRNIWSKLYEAGTADPEVAARFERKFAETGEQIKALEGVVLDWNGNKYKWTGSFGFINRLLGGDR